MLPLPPHRMNSTVRDAVKMAIDYMGLPHLTEWRRQLYLSLDDRKPREHFDITSEIIDLVEQELRIRQPALPGNPFMNEPL